MCVCLVELNSALFFLLFFIYSYFPYSRRDDELNFFFWCGISGYIHLFDCLETGQVDSQFKRWSKLHLFLLLRSFGFLHFELVTKKIKCVCACTLLFFVFIL